MNSDSDWTIIEDPMKGSGVYITARHPKKGGFIVIHSDKNAKNEINKIILDMMKTCKNNNNNNKKKKTKN